MTKLQFEGCLLGLALGDAFGAPFEGGPLERLVWRVIGTTRKGKLRWTDDTQMTLDIVESLLECGDINQDDLSKRFAGSYRWSRGYGPGAAKVLKRIRRGVPWRQANTSVFADGSFGNGGAMRAPLVGLYFSNDPEGLRRRSRMSAEMTHAHPLAIEGAELIAHSTAQAMESASTSHLVVSCLSVVNHQELERRFELANEWLQSGARFDPAVVASQLGNGIAAVESVVTAIYIATACSRTSFDTVLEHSISCGGDTDTIAAMAGALWGAARGSEELPDSKLVQLEQSERIRDLAASLYEKRSAL